MRLKFYSSRLAVLLAVIPLLLVTHQNVYAENETADHLLIYFDPPEFSSDMRKNEFNFKFFSDYAIFIGNQTQIKGFEKLLDNILENHIKSEGVGSSIIIQIEIVDSEGYAKNLYIDKQKNFEYGKMKGRVADPHFKELLERCMGLVKIIDLRFQENIITRSHVKKLCGNDDIGPCR
jgi:hypothetical protein